MIMRLISCRVMLLVGLASASAAPREDFCAVTLHVVGPDGAPITSTWIELDDPSRRVVLREMMAGPTLRICDFGFGPHTLKVGTNECFPVVISDLRVVFGSPISLDVVLNACGYREIVRSACLLYFRVVDQDGHPVPDVGLARDGLLKTDSYGRYQTLFRGSLEFAFSKQGFAPETASVNCGSTEEIDLTVVLRKIPGRA
jgi:hypothetical protein